jgi:hypothetical protein
MEETEAQSTVIGPKSPGKPGTAVGFAGT